MNTDDSNSTQAASSLQGVDGRACGTETVNEGAVWWEVHALHRGEWFQEGTQYDSKEKAVYLCGRFAITHGDVPRRVEEVMERRRVVAEVMPGSPIAAGQRLAP